MFILGPLNALKRRWQQQQQHDLETQHVSSRYVLFFYFFYFTTLIFILGPLNNFETAMAAAAGRDATRLEPLGCFFVVFFLFIYYTNVYFRSIYLRKTAWDKRALRYFFPHQFIYIFKPRPK
jgi:hypothetical protein